MNLPEFREWVRRGGARLALVGLLIVPVGCGGQGGEAETAGSESAAPASSVEASAQEPAEAPASPSEPEKKAPALRTVGVVRDPFGKPVAFSGRTTPVASTAGSPGKGDGASAAPAPEVKSRPAVAEVVAPDIRVTGLVKSGRAYRAILTGPESSYIVSEGDLLGGFKVSRISAKGVVLTFAGKDLVLPLEEEEVSVSAEAGASATAPSGSPEVGEGGQAPPRP